MKVHILLFLLLAFVALVHAQNSTEDQILDLIDEKLSTVKAAADQGAYGVWGVAALNVYQVVKDLFRHKTIRGKFKSKCCGHDAFEVAAGTPASTPKSTPPSAPTPTTIAV